MSSVGRTGAALLGISFAFGVFSLISIISRQEVRDHPTEDGLTTMARFQLRRARQNSSYLRLFAWTAAATFAVGLALVLGASL